MMKHNRRRLAGRFAILALLCCVGLAPEAWRPEHSGAAPVTAALPEPRQAYLVRPAETNVLILPRTSLAELTAQAERDRLAEVDAALDRLVDAGLAGPASYDEAAQAYRVELSDAARDALRANPLVAAVEPAATAVVSSPDHHPTGPAPFSAAANDYRLEGIKSIAFIQVNSPFVWGRTSGGSMNVELTLEDSHGVTKGVAVQSLDEAPDNKIKVDRSLYFETVFVDPTDRAKTVLIRPGDRVHLRTSGQDPTNPTEFGEEDKRIVVDDLSAWSSLERDVVAGTTNAPAGSRVIVSHSVGSYLSLTSYPAPSSYAELTVGADGRFAASSFCTNPDPKTCRSLDLKQGGTGFVRVIHPDLNEVYTVHGQNVFVLEHSQRLHGYAFALPSAPTGLLDTGITVKRPKPTVTVTLKDALGQVKDSQVIATGSLTPYDIEFSSALITGGDSVEVTINGAALPPIAVAPLAARTDLGANQVVGTGPRATPLVVAFGQIEGYITARAPSRYSENRVVTDAAGGFASGPFTCGQSNSQQLSPGSFGYVGYEDAHGNFIYLSYAAPTTHVMSDFPYLEGRLADAASPASITVRDSEGQLKHQANASPTVFWLRDQRLFDNTFHFMYTSHYIQPGDSVSVTEGGRTSVIPVDRISAYLNPDSDQVTGEAAPETSVRIIPLEDRSTGQEVVANAAGHYSAGNPFMSRSSTTCQGAPRTNDFEPGNSGRAYIRHGDGNEVFAAYGRSLHVHQNENYLDLYPYHTRGLDWDSAPSIPVTITLTSRQGVPTMVVGNSKGLDGEVTHCAPGQTCNKGVYLTTTDGQEAVIRAGDSLTAEFVEGPAGGPNRPVTVTMKSLALVTGSPDADTSTLAGVGPSNWGGAATLADTRLAAAPKTIPPDGSTVYGPFRFETSRQDPIRLMPGHAGQVSFTSFTGNRLYINWAVTSYPVKIDGFLRIGATRVCGAATAGSTVRIVDATIAGQETVIGTGLVDSQGRFCVTVDPLIKGQIILAEAGGTYSQPVVVGEVYSTLLPLLGRNGS